MVKSRRINQPSHVKALLQEQINLLRQDDSLDPIKRANAIGYLANISLTAYRDSEMVEKIKSIMKELNIE